jgi:DNA-nicking Smr family endonuclease
MRGGRVRPDMVIDLHGHSVEAAHAIVEQRLLDAATSGQRLILVVTGKGSRGPLDRRGVIRESLADWLQLSRLRPMIAAMRPAHPRHGGGGAFYVVLRRAR